MYIHRSIHPSLDILSFLQYVAHDSYFLPKIYPSGPRRRRVRRLRHQDVKRQSTLWHGTIPRRMLIRKVLSRINTASKLTGPIIDFSVAGDTASSKISQTNNSSANMSCMHPIPCIRYMYIYIYIKKKNQYIPPTPSQILLHAHSKIPNGEVWKQLKLKSTRAIIGSGSGIAIHPSSRRDVDGVRLRVSPAVVTPADLAVCGR